MSVDIQPENGQLSIITSMHHKNIEFAEGYYSHSESLRFIKELDEYLEELKMFLKYIKILEVANKQNIKKRN